MKFGNLNFLEPSGPLQDCNGTSFIVFVVETSWGQLPAVAYGRIKFDREKHN
jgi:hypothetical protein